MITISVCHRVHTGRLTSHTRGLTGGGQYVELTLSLEEQQKEMFTTYRQEEAAVRSVPCESQWLMSANRTEETTEWEWLFPVIRKSEGDLSRNGLVDNKNTRKWTWIVLREHRPEQSNRFVVLRMVLWYCSLWGQHQITELCTVQVCVSHSQLDPVQISIMHLWQLNGRNHYL